MPLLTSQPFGAEWRVLKICESHNLTSPFLARSTRVLWGIESPTTRPTFAYNAPLSTFGLLPGLGTNKNLQWQWPREIPSCGAHFPWKNIRSPRAVGRITCEFTITCEPKTHFYLRKHKESEPEECGRISARRIFLRKTHFLSKR